MSNNKCYECEGELAITCLKCAIPSADTLAGLQRFELNGRFDCKDDNGRYVLHSEAAAVVATLDKEIERLKDENTTIFETYLDKHNKNVTLKEELAQIKAQEPVAWMHPESRWADVSKKKVSVHCKIGIDPLPLYAAPVSDSLKEENERLREALTVASKYRMTADDMAIIDAALNVEASNDKG